MLVKGHVAPIEGPLAFNPITGEPIAINPAAAGGWGAPADVPYNNAGEYFGGGGTPPIDDPWAGYRPDDTFGYTPDPYAGLPDDSYWGGGTDWGGGADFSSWWDTPTDWGSYWDVPVDGSYFGY
jgi:hypothetical protein